MGKDLSTKDFPEHREEDQEVMIATAFGQLSSSDCRAEPGCRQRRPSLARGHGLELIE
jgi:hypothetical protein